MWYLFVPLFVTFMSILALRLFLAIFQKDYFVARLRADPSFSQLVYLSQHVGLTDTDYQNLWDFFVRVNEKLRGLHGTIPLWLLLEDVSDTFDRGSRSSFLDDVLSIAYRRDGNQTLVLGTVNLLGRLAKSELIHVRTLQPRVSAVLEDAEMELELPHHTFVKHQSHVASLMLA